MDYKKVFAIKKKNEEKINKHSYIGLHSFNNMVQ